MADRQLLAKLGVVVLLGLNVGAYYLFWPKDNGRPRERAELTPQVAPAERLPEAPKSFPVAAAKNAEPFSVVGVEAWKEKVIERDDAVNRLVELIQKDNVQPIPVVGDRIDVPPPIPLPPPLERPASDPLAVVPDGPPQALPPLKAAPIQEGAKIATEPMAVIGAGFTPKNPPSPWLVEVTQSGTQKLVTATLRQATPAERHVEFKILCDRVDQKGADGLQALGNVTFVGAGIKGACQRLIMPWNCPILIFEDQICLIPENLRGASSQLRSERLVWEQPATTVDPNANEFRPAGILLPSTPAPGALGTPK